MSKCSVCYTSYNRIDLTTKTLVNLIKNTSDSTDIFVIDNGSNEETVSSLISIKNENPKLKLVLNKENIGVAGAQNQVLSYISKDSYFMKLDNDVMINTPNWDLIMMDLLENNKEFGLLCIKTYAHLPFGESFKAHNGMQLGICLTTGDAIMISPDILNELGFFYEFLQYGYEDPEIFKRVILCGKKTGYVKDIDAYSVDQDTNKEYRVWKNNQVSSAGSLYSNRIKELDATKNIYVNNSHKREITSFY